MRKMVCAAEDATHSGRVPCRAIPVLALALAFTIGATSGETHAPVPSLPAAVAPDGRYARVTVDPTSTSIYIGSVSLAMPPFSRRNGVYTTGYTARVFPFFFYNERGRISIDFPDGDLRRLERGETVYFKGQAHSSDGHERRIEGRAVPADSNHGKIKVRVWVGRIELIFNTVYRFTGAE